MKVKIYIEGGGEGARLDEAFRHAWSEFFRKAGLAGRMVRPVRGKGRGKGRGTTFDLYARAVKTRKADELPLLLVDSEDIPKPGHDAWQHLKARKADQWEMPDSSGKEDAFLMICCMETWLVADREMLKKFFPQWIDKHLPKWPMLEAVEKERVLDALEKATAACDKKYRKGAVSFELLGTVNPAVVEAACPAAAALLARLRQI